MKIFLDLDEVLVDFRSAAARLHGADKEKMDAAFGVAWWSGGAFMKPIHEAGSTFWERLDRLPWYLPLIALVAEYDPTYRIVSQPTLHPSSHHGKALWAERNNKLTRLILTHDKSELARYNTVLIDDHERNCAAFRAAGGHTILFPTTYNGGSSRDNVDMSLIRQQLETIRKAISRDYSTQGEH